MSMKIKDKDNVEVAVNATFDGKSLRCMCRAPDRATFEQVAMSVGLMQHQNPGAPAVLDSETGDVIVPAVEPSGPIVPLRGITIAHLGPLVLTPGEYDEDGNEITAPVLDTRHHVNFWLPPHMVAMNGWKKWAVEWSKNGTMVSNANKNEKALKLNEIELIDPDTISSPSNVLSGF